MTLYRKKPIAIEAFLWGEDAIPDWFYNAFDEGVVIPYGTYHEKLIIKTLEGDHKATFGKDYIVKGVRGELYPVKKDIFEETYEKAEE